MIREPFLRDLDPLTALAYEFANKSAAYHSIIVNEYKISQLVIHVLSKKDSKMVCFVNETEGELEGFIFGIIMQPLFSDDWILQEMAMYSHGKGGMDLIKAFENEANARGIKKICLGCKPSFCDLGKIYKRRGYKLLEEHYLKGD
jgi:hypothetical protein